MLEIEYAKIETLNEYGGNAKLHPEEQVEKIKKSIEEFGFNDPIAVWGDNEIVEGHGRLLAAKELGLESVPIIRLDELSDEARRAYALVHNKLTMESGFDAERLAAELEALSVYDLEGFGFEPEPLDAPEHEYGDERLRTDRAYNLDLVHQTEFTSDFWQMPMIELTAYTPRELIGFNYAKTAKDKTVGVHFFIDDYQFERVWNEPEKYLEILADFDCVLSPDFSLYMDMPMPMKIWNVYRSRQIGAYWQSHGLEVIPTISWAEPETFAFCFEGVGVGGTVAVSTVGVKESAEAMRVWCEGMDAMIDRLEPKTILLYGGMVDYDFRGVEVVEFSNAVTERMRASK